MKYKDYYQTLGLEPSATTADIKTAYRKLAHKFHPDVSKDPQGEEKFKEIAEAYATLKNPEKRQEYDDLGKRAAGEEFTPPPEWQQQYGASGSNFDDVDIADILNAFRASGFANGAGQHGGHRAARHTRPIRGEDFSVNLPVSLETIHDGGETDMTVQLPELDANGIPHRVPHTFRITIPKGATQGQRLRLSGKGAAGRNGGEAGDLYVVLNLAPHAVFRLVGRDLYFDLALTPWEAALGATVDIQTLGGKLEMNIKPGTSSGQRLRLAKRGLPSQSGEAGDLYAVSKIVVPKTISAHERELYEQLASASDFKPRAPAASI